VERPRSLLMEGLRPRPRAAGPALPATGTPELRVIAGPRDDWFGAAALDVLAADSFVVTPASNRSGLRLTGPALRRSRAGELPSEGMAAGSLQVTHEGQLILLLADRPTTGGYPVIAVVVAADLGLAAQLRPGQQIRFRVSQGLAWPPAPSAG
jgi:allophanate hydrolase subunit 2